MSLTSEWVFGTMIRQTKEERGINMEMRELEYHIVQDYPKFILMFKIVGLFEERTGVDDMGCDFFFEFDTKDPVDEGDEGMLLSFHLGSPWCSEMVEHAIPVMRKVAEVDPVTIKQLVEVAEAVGAKHNPQIFSYGHSNAR